MINKPRDEFILDILCDEGMAYLKLHNTINVYCARLKYLWNKGNYTDEISDTDPHSEITS